MVLTTKINSWEKYVIPHVFQIILLITLFFIDNRQDKSVANSWNDENDEQRRGTVYLDN